MSVHLTAEQLERYGRGSLEAEDLVRLNEHLAVCEQCRSQIPFHVLRLNTLSVLMEENYGEDHLSYEMIEAYAQSLIDEVDREIVTTHIETCAECADRIKSLQHFATVLATPSARENIAAAPAAIRPLSIRQRISTAFKAPKWSYAIIGAAAVVVISIVVQQHKEWVAGGSQASMSLISPTPGRPIIESAANAPLTEIPALLKQVADRKPAGAVSLSPGGVVVRSTKPLFRWEAVSGADSYRVEIQEGPDTRSSRIVSETHWSPDTSLERGRIYTWTVTAYASGQPVGAVNAGAGNSTNATFGILSADDDRRLAETLARFPGSHLLLAATYLDMGLLEDAESELNQIDSSTDNVAMKLRARVDGIRQAMR
jgi:anti-sigma factor RsiW